MTYMDQVNAALNRTLALPTTPAWTHPVLRAISSADIDTRGLYHILEDVRMIKWMLSKMSNPAIEKMIEANDFPDWVQAALESGIQDFPEDKFKGEMLKRHTIRDAGLMRRSLMDRTQNWFEKSLLDKEYEDGAEGEEKAIGDIRELIERLRGPHPPGLDWAVAPLEEGISDGIDWYGLYHLTLDVALTSIVMKPSDDRVLNGWVDSDIPEWMRTALVGYRLASDAWSRGRQVGDAWLVRDLLGELWGSKTIKIRDNKLQEGV